VDISRSSSYGILKDNDYRSTIAAEKREIDEFKQATRLRWAEEYISKADEYWQNIIFTDECLMQNNPHKQRLWLPEEEDAPPTQRD